MLDLIIFNPINKTLKLLILCFPLVAIQACSSAEPIEQNSNSRSTMPKQFGDRFSSEKIKQEREAFYAQKLSELRNTSPTEKVNQALQANNIYLMEVPAGRGGSRSIPGLIEPNVSQVNCKTIPSEGMGDVLYGKNHMLYRQEMLKYMQEFNALMAPYCK